MAAAKHKNKSLVRSKNQSSGYLSDIDLDLSELVSVDIIQGRGRLSHPDRFLGCYSENDVLKFLEDCGLMPALRRRNYKNTVVELEVANPQDQRVFVRDQDTGENLLFMRMHIGAFVSPQLDMSLQQLKLIFIDWLTLQDPKNKRPQARELFPGQTFPGLGLFREVKALVELFSRSLSLDGAANLPEFFHDAVLFADRFQFLSPRSQGLFDALRTQLRREGLRKLSMLVHEGKVELSLGGGDYVPFFFELGEMISSQCFELTRYFESEEYNDEAGRMYRAASFRVVS